MKMDSVEVCYFSLPEIIFDIMLTLNFTYLAPHTWENRSKRIEERDRSFKTLKVFYSVGNSWTKRPV